MRLPIEREVRYKVLSEKKTSRYRRGPDTPPVKQVGSGKTLNISSRGVLFTTEFALPRDAVIELSVSWPVRLDDVVPLRLVLIGRLVRVHEKQAALVIQAYDFKTSGSASL